MDIVIDINNIDETKAACEQACQRALTKCGMVWEDHSKVYAPVDTGRLRNSIHNHLEGSDTVVIETNVEYAQYQEFGTSRQSGTPFLRPGGENHIAEYKQIIENELR